MAQLFGWLDHWRRLTVLAAVLWPATGCRLVALPFLAWGNEQARKVPAEYPYLAGKKVCILVWADPDTEFTFPYVRLEVSEHLRAALETTVHGVTLVPNRDVVDYQNRNPDWTTQHPAEIGQRFGADRVLAVELTRYTTREPGSPHLYRGHMASNIKVYDTAVPDAGPAYKTSIEVSYPPESMGAYGSDDRAIRLGMMQLFAAQTAARFHERQEKVK